MNKKILAQTIPVITSGTVAAGGVLISAVDGTAFIDVDTSKTGAADFSTAILAAVANNDVIELTSKTNGKKIYAYAKAAGTSETLSDELVTGWTNTSFNTFTSSGIDITNAIATSINQVAYSNISLSSGALVKGGMTTSVTSGLGTQAYISNNSSGSFAIPPSPNQQWSQDGNMGYKTVFRSGYSPSAFCFLSLGSTQFSIAGFSLKQVLTPSSAGVTLTNTAGGSTYNFALKDSAFTYNDTAGYNYRILSSTAYGKLIATQSPVSGTLHIATKNGEAMFFHDSIDFSAYAGTDAGSTPYLFVFYDDTGKSAQAYAGAVGGGLTTDSNLLTNGDFESGDPPDNWSALGGSTASQQADPRTGSAGSYSGQISYTSNASLRQSVSLTAGRIVCLNVWRKIIAGTGMIHYLIPDSEGAIYIASWSSSGTWENIVGYATIKTTKTHNVDLYTATSGATRTTRYDDVILSYLTDVPATGLHLMSAKNGTTRNMKSMESGFNPNTITRVNIYRSF